jgi:hypothetical protein
MAAAVAGTPFEADHLVTIACQETGYIWSQLRKKAGMTPAKIAALCVGDTLDADRGRRAFPRTAADLKAAQDGENMFQIARKAILDLADNVPGFNFVRSNTDKFAHGYGIWQYDLQFYKKDAAYFLSRGYEDPERAAKKAVGELLASMKRAGAKVDTNGKLPDGEFVKTAIAYNRGRYDPSKGLKQGHKNDEGRFYGECIDEFLRLIRSVQAPIVEKPAEPAPAPTDTQDMKSAKKITVGAAIVSMISVVGSYIDWQLAASVLIIAALAAAGGIFLLKKVNPK